MTKRLISVLIVISVLFVFTASAPAPVTESTPQVAPSVEKPVEDVAPVATAVQKARFENMLNHNYLFGEDFSSDQIMIENSILALLDKSVDGQIEQGLVLGFIAGMYGRQVDPVAATYDFLPADEGMFAILARGYDGYEHTVVSVEEIDGGYLVTSHVTVYPADGFAYQATAQSVFVENEGSAFGYNLISAEISEPATVSAM